MAHGSKGQQMSNQGPDWVLKHLHFPFFSREGLDGGGRGKRENKRIGGEGGRRGTQGLSLEGMVGVFLTFYFGN